MSSRFDISDTPLAGLKVLKRKRLGDARGYLTRLFDAEELAEIGWPGAVAQVNETGTAAAGTARGFHYQTPPFAEAKLITALEGAVLERTPLKALIDELSHAVLSQRRGGREMPEALRVFADLFGPNIGGSTPPPPSAP